MLFCSHIGTEYNLLYFKKLAYAKLNRAWSEFSYAYK